MASIQISELSPAGSKLFQDSESFLNELSDSDIQSIKGGATIATAMNNSFFNNGVGNAENNRNINGQGVNAVSAQNYNTFYLADEKAVLAFFSFASFW